MALFSSGLPGSVTSAFHSSRVMRTANSIGIERRTADHGQDFAVARVHGNDRTGLAFQRLFGSDLQIKIDGELELFAGNRLHVAERAHFLAAAVDQHLARAVLAHQDIVVILLDPRHADDVARVVQLPLRLGQHVFAHLADVADDVRHESVARIQAAVNGDGVELGQLRFVRFDEGQLVGSDVVLEEQRLISRHSGHALQAGAQLVGGDVQPSGNLVGIGLEIAVLIAQQQHGERRIVVNDDAAFAVEDLAARRQNGDLLDAVLLGQRAVVIVARYLQAPQPEGKNKKDSQQDVLHCGKPELRDFFVATEHQLHLPEVTQLQRFETDRALRSSINSEARSCTSQDCTRFAGKMTDRKPSTIVVRLGTGTEGKSA